MRKKIAIKALGSSSVEILIYDDIGDGWMGGISANEFAKELAGFGKVTDINVRINSAGGSVFDGVAMYNTLLKHPANVVVDIDGLAASIASIVAMAGDEINMADNALMMIHAPWTVAGGNADALRDQADLLDKISDTLVSTYVKRTGLDSDKVESLVEAETWMTASEAKELGFIDNVTGELKMAAYYDLSKFKNAPADLLAVQDKSNEIKLKIAKMQKTVRCLGL